MHTIAHDHISQSIEDDIARVYTSDGCVRRIRVRSTAYARGRNARARLAAIQLMTGVARIRDPHSATVRALSNQFTWKILIPQCGWRPVALSSHGAASPGHEEKAQRPRGRTGSAPRPAREPSAPTALIKCCTLHTYPFVASYPYAPPTISITNTNYYFI